MFSPLTLLAIKHWWHRRRLIGIKHVVKNDNIVENKNVNDVDSPLIDQLLQAWQHAFHGSDKIKNLEFLVVDLETSSLDPDSGEILSMGWVVIENQRLMLATAEHHLISNQQSVGQSAIFHQIRDCELEQALNVTEVFERFLHCVKGRILVFHHATLDIAFLNQLSLSKCQAPLLLPYVDTLRIEKQRLDRRSLPVIANTLRLSNCRQRYHLPSYPAHNALIDAISTAELFLAQMEKSGKSIALKKIL